MAGNKADASALTSSVPSGPAPTDCGSGKLASGSSAPDEPISVSSVPNEIASIGELLDVAEAGMSVHVECGRVVSAELRRAFEQRFSGRRCTYLTEADGGFGRDTVSSYLRFFSQLTGGGVHHEDAIAHFGLREVARTKMDKLGLAQRALVNVARVSLFEPEVCFMERPLSDLDADGRACVLTWMAEREEAGCRFVTAAQPLRQALLMQGIACWYDDGRFMVVEQESDAGDADVPDGTSPGADARDAGDGLYAGDEVRVLKIPAKADAATLLFDPREIDFAESANKATYLSVRGELYLTPRTMDELEAELAFAGFFRCHRSYLVNVQRVAKVERYTRNSFNLTLNDVAHSSIPLAKGRAEEMRSRYGW